MRPVLASRGRLFMLCIALLVVAGVVRLATSGTRKPLLQLAAVTAGATGAATPQASALEMTIAEGERLFLTETFDGNGRTCATCHRPERNFTIDPEFIKTLPQTDPLFVAASRYVWLLPNSRSSTPHPQVSCLIRRWLRTCRSSMPRRQTPSSVM